MAKRGRPKGSKNKRKKVARGWTNNSPIIKYTPVDTFWSKVIKGVNNFLKSPFK